MNKKEAIKTILSSSTEKPADISIIFPGDDHKEFPSPSMIMHIHEEGKTVESSELFDDDSSVADSGYYTGGDSDTIRWVMETMMRLYFYREIVEDVIENMHEYANKIEEKTLLNQGEEA